MKPGRAQKVTQSTDQKVESGWAPMHSLRIDRWWFGVVQAEGAAATTGAGLRPLAIGHSGTFSPGTVCGARSAHGAQAPSVQMEGLEKAVGCGPDAEEHVEQSSHPYVGGGNLVPEGGVVAAAELQLFDEPMKVLRQGCQLGHEERRGEERRLPVVPAPDPPRTLLGPHTDNR